MADSALSLLLLTGLACCVIAWHRLQPRDLRFGEAFARALALTLVGLGLAIQLLFVLGLARFPWLLDAGMAGLWGVSLRRGTRRFWPELAAGLRQAASFPCAWVLAGGFAALLATVWTAPPANWDSMTYNLARVLIMMRENTIAPHHYNTFRQLSFSPGFDLLHWDFLRYGTDRGIAVFSLLAYATITAGTFALARRHGGAAFALRVALVVASLKLLPLEATSTKNDIGAAAMAVACLLGAARFLDRPGPGTLGFLLLCAGYGLSTKSHFALFGAPFLVLVLAARRRELRQALAAARAAAPGRLAALAIGLCAAYALCLGSQWINLARFGNPFGPARAVSLHENADGLSGAAANGLRYALDVLDVPGQWWATTRRGLHARLFGPGKGPGATMAFQATFAPGDTLREDASWFGPLGALLVLPCVLAGAFRRRDRLCQATALALLVFFGLVCWKITWFSYNNRFFTLFFAASAPCLIAARGIWHDRRWLRLPILLVAGLTLAAATLANQDRPLVDAAWLPTVHPPFEASILNRPGGRRGVYDAVFHGPLLLDYLSHGVYPDGNALLVAGKDSWVYPILFYGHRQRWQVAGEDAPLVRLHGETADIRDCAALRELARRFDVTVVLEEPRARACLAGEHPAMTTRAPWGDVLVFTAGRNAKGEESGRCPEPRRGE